MECTLKGRDPFAVVATLGTTILGGFDPIKEIADVCADEGLWLHTDVRKRVLFAYIYCHEKLRNLPHRHTNLFWPAAAKTIRTPVWAYDSI